MRILAARDEGLVHNIGFSAHSEEAAVEAMDRFDFDTTMFPINCVCAENGDFGPAVIEKARERDVAILAIKGLAWTTVQDRDERPYPNCWYTPVDDPDLARLTLGWALDEPIVAAVSPASAELLILATEVGLRHEPLTDDRRAELMRRIEGVEPIFER